MVLTMHYLDDFDITHTSIPEDDKEVCAFPAQPTQC
eukprot:CAMPEP_0176497358 /NCGR_PEP_ID=MMETSP0200_2-20121128/11679_1 /TAXON_ID=947934 /ORGANISM="Chaetoceros sp., Strain GSL56" /LENGTH=35 /DNA_ID= /DNA_START= /DNA_END= /DNA_ORIENTATION=